MTLQEQFSELIWNTEYEECPHSAIYKYDFDQASKDIEKLCLEFAKGVLNYISQENMWDNLDGEGKGAWDSAKLRGETLTTEELIQEYIKTL